MDTIISPWAQLLKMGPPDAYFDPDHPDIDWIKLKTFFACKTLTMAEFSSSNLAGQLVRDFRQLLRFNELLQGVIDGGEN